MTDEEKKEYRDKLVEDCMKYNHIDYDDDKDIVETMVEAIASEELIDAITMLTEMGQLKKSRIPKTANKITVVSPILMIHFLLQCQWQFRLHLHKY